MDANRGFGPDSCQSSSRPALKKPCENAYKDYHENIKKFSNELKINATKRGNYLQGLLIDVHGHVHKEGYIELGNGIGKATLNLPIIPSSTRSSISGILDLNKSSKTINELIRGDSSIGGVIKKKNFKTTGNSWKIYPAPNESTMPPGYFVGGYTIRSYGSTNKNSNLNAIQIEFPSALRLPENHETVAKNMAEAIYEFYNKNNLGARKF